MSFTHAEVKEALFQMCAIKSLGSDGTSTLFFHKYWHIVEGDVIEMVLNFLNGGEMDPK